MRRKTRAPVFAMRPRHLAAALLTLACSGREPPGIRAFDAAGLNPPAPDVAPAQDAPVVADVRVVVPTGAVVPDFTLPDLNPASRSYQMPVTPSALRPRVTVYYFANAI